MKSKIKFLRYKKIINYSRNYSQSIDMRTNAGYNQVTPWYQRNDFIGHNRVTIIYVPYNGMVGTNQKDKVKTTGHSLLKI